MPRPPVLRCLAVMAVTVCLLPQTPASATTPPGLPPAWGAMPTFYAIEDVPFELVCADYVSDPDTPLEELRLSSGSPYVTSAEGLVVSLLFPEGVLEANVTLVASDGQGNATAAARFVVEPVDDPPRLRVVQLPDGRADEPYSFNITAIDVDDEQVELRFEDDSPLFDIGRSGTIAFLPGNDDEGLHIFNITVTDPDGLSDTAMFTIFVERLSHPYRPYISPIIGWAGEPVVFNASEYYHHFTGPVYYVDDSDLFEMNATTGLCVWDRPTLEDLGDHYFKITVRDSMGRYAEQEVKVTVRTNLSLEVDAGPDLTIAQHTCVVLRGGLTYEADMFDDWQWSFEYRNEVIKLKGRRVTYLFDDAGEYVVHLAFTRLNGESLIDSVNVTVLDAEPPRACIHVQDTVWQGHETILNGLNSSDNVEIVTYLWTIAHSETRVHLEGRQPRYAFDTPGTWLVSLKVTDAAGLSSEASAFVEVIDAERPVANAGDDVVVLTGATLVLDAAGSSDNVGILSYSWSITNGGGSVELQGVPSTFTFTVPGSYIVTLEVSDEAGNTATDSMRVSVVDEQPRGEMDEPPKDPWVALAAIGFLLAAGGYRRLYGRGR